VDRNDTSIAQPPSGERGYDAFLSYSSSDAARVRRVQRFLETYKDRNSGKKLRVFLDQTDIRGGSLRPEIESALSSSRFLIVCCSARQRPRIPTGSTPKSQHSSARGRTRMSR
jgi:hypothetical protein